MPSFMGTLTSRLMLPLGSDTFFGTTAELWLNLQRDYDLQVAGAPSSPQSAEIFETSHL